MGVRNHVESTWDPPETPSRPVVGPRKGLLVGIENLMKETRWWTRLLLRVAVASVLSVISAPPLYRLGWVGLGTAFILLVSAVAVAGITAVAAGFLTVLAHRRGLSRDRNRLVLAALLALVPLVAILPPVTQGRSVPPIHDITTDTDDPPRFREIVELRGDAPNPLTYGAGMESPDELARLQEGAYPEIRTLHSDLEVEEAVARADSVLRSQGHEVVNVEVEADRGIVEAVATTFWFGFRDDVVVRVRGENGGSTVDVRSVSRVGQSDLGTNAERIRSFLEAFRDG